MEFRIGNEPDFVMTKGKELISYTCHVSVFREGRNSPIRRVTHRSLKMVADEVLSILKGFKVEISNGKFKAEFKPLERKYEVFASSGKQSVQITLQIEKGVLNRHVAKITEGSKSYLQMPNNAFRKRLVES